MDLFRGGPLTIRLVYDGKRIILAVVLMRIRINLSVYIIGSNNFHFDCDGEFPNDFMEAKFWTEG